jgi:hypothetical protein
MEINDRFEITVKIRKEKLHQENVTFLATAFFDHDNYSEEEWGNDLPWRFSTIDAYLKSADRNYIDLTLRIHDKSRDITRVLYYLNIPITKVIVSWKDSSRSGDFEIIADVGDENADCSRTARILVNNASPLLSQYLSIESDKVISLL